MSAAHQPHQGRKTWDRLLTLTGILLVVGFVVAFAARPVLFFSLAGIDDALYMRLGQSLATGHWLGAYDHRTLIKGMGFPAFLAIANFTGLPYAAALAVFHAACASFAAFVVARLLNSRLAGLALLALLLLFPTLYQGEGLRVVRDVFYASLGLALVASAVTLAAGRILPRPVAIGLTGVLGAWWWLTREEGIWLIPTLALIALVPLVRSDAGWKGWRGALASLAPSAAAFVLAGALVTGVGAINAAVYGRFVVNEITDDAFKDALAALYEAGGPYARERVPVPAAAREQLYRASPTFASLRTLDDPTLPGYKTAGCAVDTRLCGDFGGGWFFWAVREAAASSGHNKSPSEATAFYHRLEQEVEDACHDGRLKCVDWPVDLIPPMRANQLDDVALSSWETARVIFFDSAIWTGQLPSQFGAPDAEALYTFLNRPVVSPERVQRQVTGWFTRGGAQWFEIAPSDGVRIESFERIASPDLVNHFSDPAMGRQRFAMKIDCPPQSCPATLKLEDGGTVPIDVNALHVGGHDVLGGTLFVDVLGPNAANPLLKTAFSEAWVKFAVSLTPLFRLLSIAGMIAAIAVLGRAVFARRITPITVICAALAGAVAARILILGLIDALSFPAANSLYALPAVPLLLVLTVVAIHGLARDVAGRVHRRRS